MGFSAEEKEFLTKEAPRRLFAFGLVLTRNYHEAEDLAQETLARALAHEDKFETGTGFMPWLLKIAHNYHLTQRRMVRNRYEVPQDEVPFKEAFNNAASVYDQEWPLVWEDFGTAVSGLTSISQQALLCAMNEMNNKEMAERLQTTESTARLRLYYARNALDSFREELGIGQDHGRRARVPEPA